MINNTLLKRGVPFPGPISDDFLGIYVIIIASHSRKNGCLSVYQFIPLTPSRSSSAGLGTRQAATSVGAALDAWRWIARHAEIWSGLNHPMFDDSLSALQ